MVSGVFRFFCVAISVFAFSNLSKAQVGLCPTNLDFELGDFTNWICKAGSVEPDGTILVSAMPPVPARHSIISAATAGTDPYGGFSTVCPNGSQYSVMLGNSGGAHQAESLSFTYSIPSTLTVFSVIFNYAVVLQDYNHQLYEKPRFRARIIDLSTNSPLPCVDFDFVTSAALLGFQISPSSPPNAPIYYKDWTPVSINLTPYIGRTIMLEFITNDCVYNAHFGYAYVDVNTNCNGAISGTNICQGNNSITLTAPFGFQSYQWYSDNTFTTLLSTSQTLPLNPAPAVGTVIPVIVSPYPGFGCGDTLYATVGVSPNPVSNAGPDAIICKGSQVQIGGANTPGYTYEWRPNSQVSSATIANPFAWIISSTPTEFIVKTTDILTGCFSEDTTIVSSAVVDTAIRLNGKASFCDYGIPEATLTVNNISTSYQWYNATNPIPGATSSSYQPLVTGSYWAQIVQNGCTDTTASIAVSVNPLPQASFDIVEDTLCINGGSFQFTNTSSVSDNSALTYIWKFSDGSTLQTTDAVKTFSVAGDYDIKLIITTATGCKDSAVSQVHLIPNGTPAFSWDSICINRPVLFRNLSNENGSVSVLYNWTFNDGGPGSTLKDPLPVTYTTPGNVDVMLQMTSPGCETQVQRITKQLRVNAPKPGIRYRSITIPEGSSSFIHVRDSVGKIYNWTPKVQLSSYNTQYTEFFATGNDVLYQIDITDKNTCITTDTILMQILKKQGFYLPTAFTPNGDGLNEVARPYLVGMKSLKNFSIFNRWGNLLFFTTKYGEGWNGKYKGQDQAVGVYVWILEFYNTDGKLITEKGNITLIR